MYDPTGTGASALPVGEQFSPLLAAGGLVRGSAVSVSGGPGATSLALAITAPGTRKGLWAGAVGMPDLGPGAAAELGVDLERLLLVDHVHHKRWPTVIATLVEALDVVLTTVPAKVRPSTGRRLATLCRRHATVLVTVNPAGRSLPAELEGFVPQVRLRVMTNAWEGTSTDGHGHLRSRTMTVEVSGRGRASRPTLHTLHLPERAGIASGAPPLRQVV